MIEQEQISLKELEQRDFLAYSYKIIDIAERVVNYGNKYGKIIRDTSRSNHPGIVTKTANLEENKQRRIAKHEWDHTLSQYGVLREARVVVVNENENTVVSREPWKNLRDWFELKVAIKK